MSSRPTASGSIATSPPRGDRGRSVRKDPPGEGGGLGYRAAAAIDREDLEVVLPRRQVAVGLRRAARLRRLAVQRAAETGDGSGRGEGKRRDPAVRPLAGMLAELDRGRSIVLLPGRSRRRDLLLLLSDGRVGYVAGQVLTRVVGPEGVDPGTPVRPGQPGVGNAAEQ